MSDQNQMRSIFEPTKYMGHAKHCKRVNNKFKKSYDLPLNLLQYRKDILRYSLFGIAGG